MTEDQLEQETLGWLAEVGYDTLYGPDIAPDGSCPERANYRQVLLPFRLREAIHRLNPDIPTAAREDALKQVLDLGIPALALGQPPLPQAAGRLACRCSTRRTAKPAATSCA